MQTVFVTGANRGIGLEHARRFVARGFLVWATARDVAGADALRALQDDAPDRVRLIAYDARDLAAPAQARAAIGDMPIDILLNNAGVYGGNAQGFGGVDAQAYLDTIAVNALAPLKLCEALIDNVAASTRKLIANQSSGMGSLERAGSGYYAYRASKAALNMATRSMAGELRSLGVTAIALHPGWVRTRMGGPEAPVAPEASAEGQQKLFDAVTIADSGGFFNFDGTPLPW